MQGIIILSIKKPAYSLASFNLALSIKHYNPNINITLVSDGEHSKHFRPEHYAVFDWIKQIALCDYVDSNGSFQPALAKLNINKYSTYKGTLYIDADSLVLQDLQPLLDALKGSKFKSNVISPYTQWTDEATFKEFFGVDYGVTINSSWFYFENNKVFEQANKYWLKGFDIQKIAPKWGGSLPDEMFFNASLTKLNIDAKSELNVMFFGGSIDSRTTEQIQQDFYSLTLYGGMRTVRDIYLTFYDKIVFAMCKVKGIEHRFKVKDILKGKHVLGK